MGLGAKNRLPELDGLRGLAILLVLSLHYLTYGYNNVQFGKLYRFVQIFRLGWSGVDLFFVLSGFLIGGILLDARESPNYFKAFYVRRIHRILPVYYTWIALFAIVGSIVAERGFAKESSVPLISVPVVVYYLFLQNLVFTPLSRFTTWWMSQTWSLAVEEQFYLVSPFLIRFLSRRRLTRVLAGCIIGAPILRAIVYSAKPGILSPQYVLMPCRADALAMGMLLAIAWRSDVKAWTAGHMQLANAALAVLVAGALAMTKWMPGPRNRFEAAYQYSWLAAMYAVMIMVALLKRDGTVAKVARWPFLREWGRISYCVYLIHTGVLWTCHRVLLHSLPRITEWRGVATTALALALTAGIAQISWKYFEKPLIDRGHAARFVPSEADALASPG
ncbi:MAG: acyltransferase [Candidatus Acidiferrales bacterium]